MHVSEPRDHSTDVFALLKTRGDAECRAARALAALARIERACRRSGDQLQTILEIAADTLAELRDPATGRAWGN